LLRAEIFCLAEGISSGGSSLYEFIWETLHNLPTELNPIRKHLLPLVKPLRGYRPTEAYHTRLWRLQKTHRALLAKDKALRYLQGFAFF
jgi:hypothetical protein